MDDDNLQRMQREINRTADEFVLTCYVFADETGTPIGDLLERSVLDARARLVEQGLLTDERED